jgi:4-amino-4-deoxy-L-arabinose transferase-like glycosyltransferase
VNQQLLAALIAAFALAYAAISVLSTGSGAIHQDMVEAYVWGRQFELGYYKHPPLWAWIAGGWFSILPRTAWAFALLCGVNVAAGLWGSWLLIGQFASGDRRLAAFLLLLVTPFYGFTAYVFNANSIFISLWPWTAYAFVRAMDERRLIPAAAFGALAAADMLSKYYALALLLACLAAALAHPKAKAYFTSPSPWVSVLVGAVLVAPHVWWLTQTGFLPFSYFHTETGRSLAYSAGTAGRLLLADLASLAIVMVLVFVSARSGPRRIASGAVALVREPRLRLMTVLALAPLILTLIFGLAFRLKLSSNWTIAIFPLAPLALIELADPPRPASLARFTVGLAVIAAMLGLILAPLTDRFSGPTSRIMQPTRELASTAAALWRARTQAPIAIVGGDELYAEALAFYGPDRPQVFVYFDPHLAPWITPGALAARGLLAVCPAADTVCVAGAVHYSTPATDWTRITLTRQAGGHSGLAQAFIIGVTPPPPQG